MHRLLSLDHVHHIPCKACWCYVITSQRKQSTARQQKLEVHTGHKKCSLVINSEHLTKKNYVPLCPLGILRGYLALCFPTMLFKGLIHPFHSCSYKCILSHTKFIVLKMYCTSSTRASSRASICSIPTLIQLPPGWHSSKSYGRR